MDSVLARAILADLATGETRVVALSLEDGSREILDPAALADDHPLAEAVRTAAATDRAGVVEVGNGRWFLQVFAPEVRVIIIGGVHIAQALAPMCALAGFTPLVVDHRANWLTAERFPGITRVVERPEDAMPHLGLDARTAVVALTHNPTLDDPALLAALASPAFYVGALGSKKTQAGRRERLAAKGVSEAALDRIHGPIGLNIGARKPAHIAVSILGEIIANLPGGGPKGG